MVFKAHNPHSNNKKTFLGYFKDDGYVLKKHQGKIDQGFWQEKKEQMLNLYINKESKPTLSIMQSVSADDEWCAEAYMATDYSSLNENDFIKTIKEYLAFQFLNSKNE
ncbi:MAG TPA: hypothetical protein LFV92_01210 [Rickettsia endosymbiont of Ceroptres masudai]|nr:hypothetical protein [Rickettsia endosymbiont of Ceroptres masudai]